MPDWMRKTALLKSQQLTLIPVQCEVMMRCARRLPRRSFHWLIFLGHQTFRAPAGKESILDRRIECRGLRGDVAQGVRAAVQTSKQVEIQGHIHQLRHTFAKRMLLSGAPMESVSQLLGHRRIEVTQRHYNKWMAERQADLEAIVRNSWLRIGDTKSLKSRKPHKH
jgi:integrase